MAAGPDRVPDARLPRKRWPALSRVLFSLMGLTFLGGLAGGAVAFYAYQEYTLPGPLEDKKVFEVKKGLGTPDIAAALEEQGIISDAKVFSAVTFLKGARGALKAGEYEFPAAATMRDVMALIESGRTLVYKLSVPEGWTSDAALTRIAENQVLTGEVTAPPAEGAILPDTYVFRRGMTRQKLIDDMRAAQAKLLDDLWAKRNPAIPLTSKEEAVILASIVEKETAKADERPVIASVFMNRLAKNMRLQSDPTIIYGITGGKGKLDRALTKADITTPTPYNTYTINGLPPGPIANPGREALAAVMNPPPTSYLYFVADGSGGHAFAATLEEHNKNVAEWRKINQQQASAAAMDDEPAGDAAPEPGTGNVLPDIAEPSAKPGTSDDSVKKLASPGGGDAGDAGAAAAIPAPDATATDGLDQAAKDKAAKDKAAKDKAAKDKAAKDKAATPDTAQAVAGEGTAGDTPSVALPGDTTAAKPSAVEPAPATTAAKEKTADFEPGSVITVGKRLIPIPKNKPKP
jgi:UPF0755 protein